MDDREGGRKTRGGRMRGRKTRKERRERLRETENPLGKRVKNGWQKYQTCSSK